MRKVFVISLFFALVFSSSAFAIPEADINKFRASARGTFEFDSYYSGNLSRFLTLRSFHNEASYYYVVFRANAGDAVPYDDFFVTFICQGDISSTTFRTSDYPSWVETGQISFKRQFWLRYNETYFNSTVNITESFCSISSASNLTVNNNAGYSTFYMELVPLLQNIVLTDDKLCEIHSAQDALESGITATGKVVSNNINIFYTLFIVVQMLAIIFVVIGIPIMLLLFIRWVIYRLTGRRLFEREER